MNHFLDLGADAHQEYERLLAPTRERFAESPGVLAIQCNRDEVFLEAFLLHFCALGARMTEPVEGWIRRAAERCASMGLPDLADALAGHARAEAGHHLLMVADVRALAAHWNTRRRPLVDADELLGQPSSAGVLEYCKAHEENIAGPAPYAQIAIEYEIEMLPLRYGELFIARCVEVLGMDILPCLSFVTEHIVLDVGHTKFNTRALTRLLGLMPSCMPALVSAGTAVLDAYAQFLTDCARLASLHAREAKARTANHSVPLSWDLRAPLVEGTSDCPGGSPPEWLNEVRSLRGAVLFDHGRRPHFRTQDGHLFDADPIDLYSYHILAYSGLRLVGCVRVSPLNGNGPCVTEKVLGENAFSELLHRLGRHRSGTVEIGRWIVDPEYRASGRPAIQLAAAAAALARTLCDASVPDQGIVVCTVGVGDQQDLMLGRIGLTAVPAVQCIRCADFNDRVRMMYCAGTQQLDRRFLRIVDNIAENLGLKAKFGRI
jgi:hypothetical protein